MCELLGFTAKEKTDIKGYLDTFFVHSVNNPHGWGIMYEDRERTVIKEAVSARESTFLSGLIEGLPLQKNFLAHIRLATVGSLYEQNCHPFTGTDNSRREWTLIHNGTIYSSRNTHHFSAVQKGDTDSERLFLAMIEYMNSHIERGIPNERERFEIINRFIVEHSPRNKLNLIIYDGDMMYVHKNLKNTLCFKSP